MRQATKHAIAVVVVATALCADGTASASRADWARPQSSGFARSLAARLTVSLRQVVPGIRVLPERREGERTIARPQRRPAVQPVIHATGASPFRFRLPPPIL
jgi:hypothetical protein